MTSVKVYRKGLGDRHLRSSRIVAILLLGRLWCGEGKKVRSLYIETRDKNLTECKFLLS